MIHQTVFRCVACFLLILPGTALLAQIPSKPAEDKSTSTLTSSSNTWPLMRGDAQATGVAKTNLPEKLELLWRFSTEKGGFQSTAAIVDSTVYVGCMDGKLYAMDLATGAKRWAYSTESSFKASPGVYQGRVFIGDTAGRFYCVDAATGKLQWSFDTDGEIDSGPNFFDNHVLFGSQDAMLYCLDVASGQLVWKYESANQIRCFSSVLGNLCFVAGCDGLLHAIELGTGKSAGEVNFNSPTGSSPAIMDGKIFVGTEGNEFFAIDPKQSKVLWRYQAKTHPAPFRSSAAVIPEAVIVGSRDKLVHALDPKKGWLLWSFAPKRQAG